MQRIINFLRVMHKPSSLGGVSGAHEYAATEQGQKNKHLPPASQRYLKPWNAPKALRLHYF
jgi:hypothetical protein